MIWCNNIFYFLVTHMSDKVVNIAAIAQEQYVPSSLERKRSILMYFLLGIIISFSKGQLTEFEQYHLKQAVWFWLVVILWILLVSILLIIPKIRIIFLPISVILLVYLVVFIQQCLSGKWMQWDSLKKKMFYWLGSRVLMLFES